jgi:hypothetical protein
LNHECGFRIENERLTVRLISSGLKSCFPE